VSPNVNEVMLGIRFLKQAGAIWNFDLGEVVLSGYWHKLHSRGQQSWCRRVVLQNDTVVPGESEMDLSTLVQYNNLYGPKINEPVDWVREAREVTLGVCVSRTLLPDHDEDVSVGVINITKNPVIVKAGTIISDLYSAQVCFVHNKAAASMQEPDSTLLGMVDNVDESVSDGDRHRLGSLLTEFSNTFSKDENDLGWMDIVDTGDSKPVR